MAVSRTEGRADDAPTGTAAEDSGGAASIPLVGRVRDRVNQELNARKDRASEVIQGLAGTVRRIGEPLHDESLGALASYADEAAARLDRLASGLRDREVAELADDVRRLAREHPGVFAAVGFAAGFAAARFLKSSAEAGAGGGDAGRAAGRAGSASTTGHRRPAGSAGPGGGPGYPGTRSGARGERIR